MDEVAKMQSDEGQFLRNIPQCETIDFGRIPPYIPPFKDKLLRQFAIDSRVKYIVSTSTISAALSTCWPDP